MAAPDRDDVPALIERSIQHLTAGSLDEAEALAERALRIARGRGGAVEDAQQALYVLSEIADRRGEAARARALLGAAYGSRAARWDVH